MANPWFTFLKEWVKTKQNSDPSYNYRKAMSDPASKAEYNKTRGKTSAAPTKSKKGKTHGGTGNDSKDTHTASAIIAGGDASVQPAMAGGDVAANAKAVHHIAGGDVAANAAPAIAGGRKSRRRKGKKSARKSKKSKKRKSRSSRK